VIVKFLVYLKQLLPTPLYSVFERWCEGPKRFQIFPTVFQNTVWNLHDLCIITRNIRWNLTLWISRYSDDFIISQKVTKVKPKKTCHCTRCSGPCFDSQSNWSVDCTCRMHLARWRDAPLKTHTSTRAGQVRVNECMYVWEPAWQPASLFLHFSRRRKPFCLFSVWAYASWRKIKIINCTTSDLGVYKNYKY